MKKRKKRQMKKDRGFRSLHDMCLPKSEGGVGLRSLHEVMNALFGKLWWSFRKSTSLWSSYMWNKYCKKQHHTVVTGTGPSHAWRKMLEVRGALYFIEDTVIGEEEVEVKQFIVNGEWDRQRLSNLISEEMTDFIVETIRTIIEEGALDIPWWMGSKSGKFTVKSAFERIRRKKEKVWWWSYIWSKGVPFKINFLLWRSWKGIRMEGGLQQAITKWWEEATKPKLKAIFQVIPAILMWELWKRRNSRRNGREVKYETLLQQCQEVVFKLVKTLYPWIRFQKSWENLVEVLKEYKPKLYYQAITWVRPQMGWKKCNTDGAIRGNPRESTYIFCTRNIQGRLVYAEAQRLGIGNSMEAESRAILRAQQHCQNNNITNVIVETDSLCLSKIIKGEWRIPWQHTEEID
ncbi:uncharacterized protein LOC125827594 [Solanum verrucosum]|uniref:uncharacterized protein LOC125827594 n=1 Tax=Solanum verrucosum TaxID=315347 RepID=UPI0020D07495|nr:uncharacterized protein LOC125827594 [Solanum verrucosum]